MNKFSTDLIKSLSEAAEHALLFTDDLNSQITDLVNLKYLLLPPGAPGPGPKFQLVYDGSDGRIYQNSNVFPRVFVVSRARTCMDDASALVLIRSGRLDLRREVVIAGCPDLRSDVRRVTSSDLENASVEVQSYSPTQILVRAAILSPGFLVFTDTYDNGWRVSVDGSEAQLFRADYAFRAVALNPGSHEVRFLYQPFAVVLGLAVSSTALLGTLALISLGAIRGRPG